MKKRLLIIILLLAVSILLCSCDGETMYRGDDYALFTEVMNSLLYFSGGSFKQSSGPSLVEIERDNYGRTFFFYYERRGYCYCIAQKYDSKYVYYYEDFNFIIAPIDDILPDGEIEKLKEINDWNKEINLSKCIKKEIITHKEDLKLKEETIENIFKEIYNKDFNIRTCRYLTSNGSGKIIVSVFGDDVKAYEEFVIIIDSKYNYTNDCILKIYDDIQYNYQEELRELKLKNDWY